MKEKFKVILFYKFTKIKNPKAFVIKQKKICSDLGLKGRILVAEEGINGTLEGKISQLNKYKKTMREVTPFRELVFKESDSLGKSFTGLKIKVRDEIVTLKAGTFNIKKETAKEVSAVELEKMYKKDEDFLVLDLRNDYEVKVGQFNKTYNPKLNNFYELPKKLKELAHLKDKKLVTVCTGGIRCEKATCLLRREGFKNLYQLKDGIHTYIKKYPNKNFKGSLFVFDNRMTTSVVDVPKREIIGKCEFCDKKCETFFSDDSIRPSRKLISCKNCAKTRKNLRESVTV